MKRREYLAAGSAALIGSAGCLGSEEDDGSDGENNGNDSDPNSGQEGQPEKDGSEDVFTAAESDEIDDFVRTKGQKIARKRNRLEDLSDEREDSDLLPPTEGFSWGNRQAFSPTESTVFYHFSGDESTQLETQGNTYKSASDIRPFGNGDRSVESDLRDALDDLELFDNWRSANEFVKYDLDNDNAFQDLRDFIDNIQDTQPYFRHFGDDEELTVPEDFDEDVADDLDDVLDDIEGIEDGYRELVNKVAKFNEDVDGDVEDFFDELDTVVDEDSYTGDEVSEDDADEYRRGLNNLEQGVDALYADVLGDAAEVILTRRLYEDARDQARDVLEDLEEDERDNEDDDHDDDYDRPDNDPEPDPEPEAEYRVKTRRVLNENEIYEPLKDRSDGNMDDYHRNDLLGELKDYLEEDEDQGFSSEELFNGEHDPFDVVTIDLRWDQNRDGDVKNVGVAFHYEFEERTGFTTRREPDGEDDIDYFMLDDDFGEELIEYVQDEDIQ